MKEDVLSVIEEVTSIPTLIRELSALRVMKQILFEKHHLKLLPLVQIELEKRRLESGQDRKGSKVADKKQVAPLGHMRGHDFEESGPLDFRSSIEMLKPADSDRDFSSGSEKKAHPLRRAVDQLFLDLLPDFLKNPEGLLLGLDRTDRPFEEPLQAKQSGPGRVAPGRDGDRGKQTTPNSNFGDL